MRLGAADAVGGQRDDMAVAAVLTQQVARVPQPRERLLRGRQRPQRCVEGTSLCPGAGGRLDGEAGSPRDAGVAGEVAEHPPERRGAPSVARRQRRLGRDQVPDTRDVAGGLARSEVVEDRVHDAGRDIAAQRGCPAK